ncbi:murein biosynthesis integral membrane protein MurJ [Bacillus niameyensis]|uniref:murein biosynthesis integral membrane protein MurJ n=1 Tax=Bacillus niameyensis TaxID=1522308 RepID=UPI0007816C9B|nr:murein biosynthesis integral membrane protein MurJ [Bacillus niameyensis]
MKKTALIIMLITIFVKISGFAREILLSFYYGASEISDAYFISITISGTVFSFIGVAISTSFIPMYSNISSQKNNTLADRFTSNVLNLILLLCLILVIIAVSFTDPLVRLFASGFKGETFELAVLFTRVAVLGIFFSGIMFLFNSYLQIKNNFVIPALMAIPQNIIIVLSIILSSKSNVIYLAIGTTLAVVIQVFLTIPFVKRRNFRYNFILDFRDGNIKKMIFLSLPIILGVSINEINVLVDRTIASQVAIGGVSALNYANRLILFIQGIFVMSIVTVMYPMISKMSSEGNLEGLKKSVSESINSVNLLVVPITVGFLMFSNQIISILFGRGAFNEEAIVLTSSALFFYSIGIVGIGLREVLSRVFYSLQDTKTPMINAAISLFINIILNLILSKYLGIGGLALATSVSAIIGVLLLFRSLKIKVVDIRLKGIGTTFIKVVIASVIMGIISKSIYANLLINHGLTVSLFSSVLVAIITYFVLIYFMKIDVFYTLIDSLKRKIFKRGNIS